jgi:hypothetical protein
MTCPNGVTAAQSVLTGPCTAFTKDCCVPPKSAPKDARDPASFLPLAREVIERRDDLDAPVAFRDQLDEAERETKEIFRRMKPGFRRVLGDGGEVVADNSSEALAWNLAFGAAVDAWVKARCAHWQLNHPRPLLVDLTSGVIACQPCLDAGFSRIALKRWADDGRCDICDTPTEEFRPFVMRLGPLVATGHICESCWQWGCLCGAEEKAA